jgi:hypothetical protein
MKRSGTANLPLHYGHVPQWLSGRMAKLGLAISESIIAEFGKNELLRRLSDPFLFQSFGAVLGMDWHSSGITTSVMGAMKRALNPHAKELGIFICGGKGKASTQAPEEIIALCDYKGLDANYLIRCSKLSAKVDNTAIQDGFQLYIHNFIISDTGEWTMVQQGMRTSDKTARRYHWHSLGLKSFVEEPHTAICGINQGTIVNMTAAEANAARNAVVSLTYEKPEKMMQDVQQLLMPAHHEIRTEDIDLKRLGSVLWLAHDMKPANFEELLLLQGIGPRTIQSLALVSEVIYGTPSRFKDSARFSFAHGGKDGHPFPVPLTVYDETITTLQIAVQKAKLDNSDKQTAIKKLHELARDAEKNFLPIDSLDELVKKEREESWIHGSKTVLAVQNAGEASPRVFN